MATEAQRRRQKKQDATRTREPVWLDPAASALLDKLRGDHSRVEYVRILLANAKGVSLKQLTKNVRAWTPREKRG